MSDLRAERDRLAAAEYNSYSPDAFPGSRAWRLHHAAEISLREFDAQHPEVLAAIKAEPASRPAYMDDPGSTYNRALRGED